jgi:hypothetical protein
MTTVTVDVTKIAAIEALIEHSFVTADDDVVIHCFIGFIGCDWTLEEAVQTVLRAERVQMGDHLLGHDLIVTHQGSRMCFDVPRRSDARNG